MLLDKIEPDDVGHKSIITPLAQINIKHVSNK
jgi:hypothetical protein